jgi:hypothetical protein
MLANVFSPSQLPSVPSPQESTVMLTIYRNTSTAQAFLHPVQVVADMIPDVGSIIEGAIGGTLSL